MRRSSIICWSVYSRTDRGTLLANLRYAMLSLVGQGGMGVVYKTQTA
jgi:hypothetical protein